MSFQRNLKIYFNEESLAITYHNIRYKSLVRPKSKLRRISTHKPQGQFFRDKIHIADHTK